MTPPAELHGRLHPLAIVLVLRRFVGAWILPLLVVALTWHGGIAIPALVVVVGAGLAYGVLTWLRFTYAVVGDRLEIRQGVLERKLRVVPIVRIRGVDVSAPALHRLLGLVRVEVEAASGGSSSAELTLAAVTRAEGEALRLRLLERATAPLDVGDEREARVLYRATPGLLAAGGITSGRYLLAPLAVAGVVFNLADDLPGSLGDRLISGAADRAPGGGAGLLVLVGVVACAAAALAVLGSLLIDWNFTVRDETDHLVAVRGLVTHRAVTIERTRIRGVDVTDSPLRRAVGLVGAAVVAGGLGGGRRGRASVAPVIRRHDAHGLLRAIDPLVPDPSGVLVAHPRAALVEAAGSCRGRSRSGGRDRRSRLASGGPPPALRSSPSPPSRSAAIDTCSSGIAGTGAVWPFVREASHGAGRRSTRRRSSATRCVDHRVRPGQGSARSSCTSVRAWVRGACSTSRTSRPARCWSALRRRSWHRSSHADAGNGRSDRIRE